MRLFVSLCALVVAQAIVAASPHPAKADDGTMAGAVEGQTTQLDEEGANAGPAVRSGKVACDCKGRVQKKILANGKVEEYIYHPRTEKLILILSEGKRSVFHYNDDAKLVRAENSDGQTIDIAYNDRGLVRTMHEADSDADMRRTLHFSYQEASDKPTEIHLVGIGKINVAYDEQGEITGVHSKGGTRMAIEVAKAFQSVKALLPEGGLQ